MHITPVQNSSNNYGNPAFKELRRKVFTKELMFYRNDTWFYRDRSFWKKLSSFLENAYKDVPKVNVYSYGCSDGSEVFTFIMEILSKENNDLAKKFLPVIAKDIDENVIKGVNMHKYFFMNNEEKKDIDRFTNGKFERFFTETNKTHISSFAYAKPELYNNAEFSQADIWEDYTNINPTNSVVFVRNFWPYIVRWQDKQKLLNKISSQLKENSYIVVGDFDMRETCWQFASQIIEAGFKSTPLDYVYKK